jgi:hypothetical protein
MLILLAVAATCKAADYVWTGAGGDSAWNTPANWKPDTGYPRSGDSATFPQTTSPVTVALHGDQAVRSIVFDPVQQVSYTITGDTLTLDDGGSILFRKLAQDAGMHAHSRQIIESAIRLAGRASFGNENRWYFGNELMAQVEGAGSRRRGGPGDL